MKNFATISQLIFLALSPFAGANELVLSYADPGFCKEDQERGDSLCEFQSRSDSLSPKWSERRYDIKSAQGRRRIVERAARQVEDALIKCSGVQFASYLGVAPGPGLEIATVVSANGDMSQGNLYSGLKITTSPWYRRKYAQDPGEDTQNEITISVKYVSIQRHPRHGAYSTHRYSCRNREIRNHHIRTNEIVGVKYQLRQEFNEAIHIFPYIFETGELFIPTEERWAENPVEAIFYAIAHELGHVEEFFVDTWVRTPRTIAPQPYSVGDHTTGEEDFAWEFATSLAMCAHDDR